ncbi:MAG TPA: GspH/FimT family pseudopilin [Burkholderiales bacterium]|nr:GspH/FimT family pseudopilin [Burkholderiales bacterium]
MRTAAGFTLPELLIVMTVLAILVAAGLPSFGEFVRNQRLKTASFDLFSTLVVARSEAINRNASVTLAPVVAGNWSGGWTVTAAGGTVIRSQEAIPDITIAGPDNLVYSGSGRLSGAVAQFSLTASGSNVVNRCISIDLSGRPVSKAAAC